MLVETEREKMKAGNWKLLELSAARTAKHVIGEGLRIRQEARCAKLNPSICARPITHSITR